MLLLCCASASMMGSSAEMEEGAPSNWRPPWLDTTMASPPCLYASTASSGDIMPLRISGPSHASLIQAISFQLSWGSNWSAVQDAREVISATPVTWPTILPKLRRLVLDICQHHSGRRARSRMLSRVGLGGVLKPFLMSLWRCPMTWRSKVNTKAEQPASFARPMSRRIKSRSFMT